MSARHRLHVRVRYAETDQMGVVYHAHYLIWMEVGRTELLRTLGHPYDELERAGLLFAVSDVRCRFPGSARYGDTVVVTTELAQVRSRRVTFAYDVAVENGARAATGEVSVVALDRERRPCRIPGPLFADLQGAIRSAPAAREPRVALLA
ncbi:MAG: acyl-CoA thioesterase [Gemmatimonadota bacterium]